MKRHFVLAGICIFLTTALPAHPAGDPQGQQGHITSPGEEFGHDFGDDYFLASYRQIADYWQKLARESKRIVLEPIGKTAEGRTQLMAILTSPENHRNLARYRDISARLARAEGLTDDQARAGQGGENRRVDRRWAARQRVPGRPTAWGNGLPDGQPQ